MVHQFLVFRFTDDNVITAPRICGLLTVPDFIRQVQRWHGAPGECLIADLSQVEELEMTVLRAVLWARRSLRVRGYALLVVEPPAGVLNSPELPIFRSLLRFCPDLLSARMFASPTEEAPVQHALPHGSVGATP